MSHSPISINPVASDIAYPIPQILLAGSPGPRLINSKTCSSHHSRAALRLRLNPWYTVPEAEDMLHLEATLAYSTPSNLSERTYLDGLVALHDDTALDILTATDVSDLRGYELPIVNPMQYDGLLAEDLTLDDEISRIEWDFIAANDTLRPEDVSSFTDLYAGLLRFYPANNDTPGDTVIELVSKINHQTEPVHADIVLPRASLERLANWLAYCIG